MLKTIIFITLLASNSVFAATDILTKHVTSGNVRPEDSFQKDCHFIDDGHLKITIKNGNGTPVTHTHHISSARIAEIKALLKRAHNGRIVEVGATCDGGTNIVHGFDQGHLVILDENIDCGRHRVNQSSATPRLKSIAQQSCGF